MAQNSLIFGKNVYGTKRGKGLTYTAQRFIIDYKTKGGFKNGI